MTRLKAENKDLKARLERLESISIERLVLAGKPRKTLLCKASNRD